MTSGEEVNKPLYSFNELVDMGMDRFRLPKWSNPEDHIKIDLYKRTDGTWSHTIWGHLYSPLNEVLGYPNPQDFIIGFHGKTDWDLKQYEIYEPAQEVKTDDQ